LSDLDDTATEKKEEQPKSEKSKRKKGDKVIVVPPAIGIETYNFLANHARNRRTDRLANYWERLIWGD